MSNLKNFDEIKNKLEKAKIILNKPLITKSEKKILRKLKISFTKEITTIKKYKEINKENLFNSLKLLKDLKLTPYLLMLKEIFFMSFPLFFTFLVKLLEEPLKEDNTETKNLAIINFEKLKSFITLSSTIGAFISGFYSINRMIPAHTELTRIHNRIVQFDKHVKDLKQLVKKEALLPDLETVNTILEKLDSISFSKLTFKTNDKLLSFFAHAPQNEEIYRSASQVKRQLFK
ncbi:MAG: hypothetical protein REH83_01005 [Rickettsiella sp.]|nr:hypothetical protein [Rickettsiella sp.]